MTQNILIPIKLEELEECKKLIKDGDTTAALNFLDKLLSRENRLEYQEIPVKIFYKEKPILEGVADGINENGMGVDVNPIEEGATINLAQIVHAKVGVLLENSDLPMNYYSGEVVRVDPPKNNKFKFYIAIKFTELQEELKNHIKGYIGWVQ